MCLFPTRKQCDVLNEEMLRNLESEVHVKPCTDDVDETRTTAKWHQKAAKQLEKLNQDWLDSIFLSFCNHCIVLNADGMREEGWWLPLLEPRCLGYGMQYLVAQHIILVEQDVAASRLCTKE